MLFNRFDLKTELCTKFIGSFLSRSQWTNSEQQERDQTRRSQHEVHHTIRRVRNSTTRCIHPNGSPTEIQESKQNEETLKPPYENRFRTQPNPEPFRIGLTCSSVRNKPTRKRNKRDVIQVHESRHDVTRSRYFINSAAKLLSSDNKHSRQFLSERFGPQTIDIRSNPFTRYNVPGAPTDQIPSSQHAPETQDHRSGLETQYRRRLVDQIEI